AAIIRHRLIFIRVFQSSSCRVFFKFPVDTNSPKKRLGLEAGRRPIRDEDVGQRSAKSEGFKPRSPGNRYSSKAAQYAAASRSHSNVKAKRAGCHHAVPSTSSTVQRVRPISPTEWFWMVLDIVKIQDAGEGEKSVASDLEAVLRK